MPDTRTIAVSRSQAIRTRLVLAFLFITILPLVVVGVMSITGTLAQRDQIYSQLGIVTHAKRTQIRFWVESLQADLEQMVTGRTEYGWIYDVLRESRQARFLPVYALLLNTLNEQIPQSQFNNVFIMNSTGQVVFSTDPTLLDQNFSQEPFFQAGQKGPSVNPPLYGDQGTPDVIITRPIADSSGNTLGVVGGRAGLSQLTPIMQDTTGLGVTGDAYLVDKNHVTLLPSRYNQAGVIAYNAGTVAALTNYNETAQNIYTNHLGASVTGVAEWVPELQVALVAERDMAELTQASNATQAVNLSIAISAVLISFYASLLLSRSIGRPLSELADTVSQIAQGNLRLTANVELEDEVAVVAQAINSMTVQLQDMIGSLETRVEMRTAQLQASAEVGKAAASVLNPDRLLHEVVNLIADRFGFYYAAIFTLDRTSSYLMLREATGEAGRTLKERGHRLRVSMDSMVGYAVLRHEPRVAMNVSEDTVRFANPLLPDAQSEVALPLIVGQEVIGALDVQSTHLNAFDESMLTALQAMASQVAVALQNAQSFQSLQKTLDYTTRQYELSRNIFLAQTPNEAYLTLGQAFAMFAEVDRIQLLRVVERDADHQPAVYELVIEWDILGGAQMDTGTSYAAAETPLAALVAEDKAVVIRDANDTHLPATTRERLAQVNAQAIILVPLQIGAEYSGFVAAISEQPRDFTESEVRLLKSTAEQLGVVLVNLQLTAEMRTTVERVALLNRRLSGEAWDSYRAGRAQLRVESGHVEFATPEHQLQVPIVVRGETIGAFNVADNNLERSWNEDELSLLQTIAGEVALAIDNARLIEQTQRTAQREKDIAIAADQIHRSMNLETILNTALGEIVRITGVEDVAIQFGSLTSLPDNSQHAARL